MFEAARAPAGPISLQIRAPRPQFRNEFGLGWAHREKGARLGRRSWGGGAGNQLVSSHAPGAPIHSLSGVAMRFLFTQRGALAVVLRHRASTPPFGTSGGGVSKENFEAMLFRLLCFMLAKGDVSVTPGSGLLHRVSLQQRTSPAGMCCRRCACR